MAFDPAYTATGLALSNNNLTATLSPSQTQYYRTTLSTNSPSGKIYVEIKMTSSDLTNSPFGLGIHGMDIGPSWNAGLGGIGQVGFYSNAYSVNNIGHPGVLIAYSSNDIMALALDTVAKTVQIRNVTQNSAWSTAISIAALAGPLFFGYTTCTDGDTATANFSGPFVGALPPGYVGWSPAPQGWGQKIYTNRQTIFNVPSGTIPPTAWANRTLLNTHNPMTWT